jgi:hypothetical protein
VKGIYPMQGNHKMGAWGKVGAAAQRCCRALRACIRDVMGRDGERALEWVFDGVRGCDGGAWRSEGCDALGFLSASGYESVVGSTN